jgi:hypothetical protein
MNVVNNASGDASILINAELARSAAQGGGEVMLPAGHYSIPSTSSIIWPANANGVSLIGEGPFASTILTDARGSDLLDLTAGNLSHVRIAGLGISVAGPCIGGALIHAADCYDLIVERVRLDGPYNNGIAIDGGPNQYLTTLINVVCPGDPRCYCCVIIGQNVLPQDTYINLCKFAGTQYGIWVQNASGVYLSSTEVLDHVHHGFVTYPMAGQVAEWVQATQFIADTCGETGIYLGSGGGNVRGVSFSNSWSSNNNNGVEIEAAPLGDNICFDAATMILVNRNRSVIDYGATNVRISAYMDKP